MKLKIPVKTRSIDKEPGEVLNRLHRGTGVQKNKKKVIDRKRKHKMGEY